MRTFRRGATDPVVRLLKPRSKAILFAPLEASATLWQEFLANPIIALESTVSITESGLSFDTDYVESRLLEAGLGAEQPRRPRQPRRSKRAARIEILTAEVIKHLRAARDHAKFTQEQSGAPELLPRPSQKALGERVGLSETAVSRCFSDKKAKELNLYWDTALDPTKILGWRGPISKGRKR